MDPEAGRSHWPGAYDVNQAEIFENGFRDASRVVQAGTLSQSKDTRSQDLAFTVVSTANDQSASSTPFDIFNRDLNYALSDFDRTHVFQAQTVWELPFGEGRRLGGGVKYYF